MASEDKKKVADGIWRYRVTGMLELISEVLNRVEKDRYEVMIIVMDRRESNPTVHSYCADNISCIDTQISVLQELILRLQRRQREDPAKAGH